MEAGDRDGCSVFKERLTVETTRLSSAAGELEQPLSQRCQDRGSDVIARGLNEQFFKSKPKMYGGLHLME
jgi:hypothetical protein